MIETRNVSRRFGSTLHQLYKFLTDVKPKAQVKEGTDFEGKLVHVSTPEIAPDDAMVAAAIDKTL